MKYYKVLLHKNSAREAGNEEGEALLCPLVATSRVGLDLPKTKVRLARVSVPSLESVGSGLTKLLTVGVATVGLMGGLSAEADASALHAASLPSLDSASVPSYVPLNGENVADSSVQSLQTVLRAEKSSAKGDSLLAQSIMHSNGSGDESDQWHTNSQGGGGHTNTNWPNHANVTGGNQPWNNHTNTAGPDKRGGENPQDNQVTFPHVNIVQGDYIF